jgi:hypothetical protein
LIVPLAGVSVFFALSWVTVRAFQPRDPKRFFLLYAALLLVAAAVMISWRWPIQTIEDALGLGACVLLQALACLTIWNAFYSLLWGFSGSLIHDLHNDPALRDRERLIRSYEGERGVDRILARRLPNLAGGGWVDLSGETLRLRSKGRLIAVGTLVAFKAFSLGLGGGVK